MNTKLDRRRLLQGAAALGGLSLLPGTGFASRAVRDHGLGKGPIDNLILFQLSGGNDGLSMLVPFDEDGYGRVRTTTRRGKADVLPLSDHVGLNTHLKFLRGLYDAGNLAIVQGVGYPDANRSHFKSLDIWHSASADGRSAKSGWVGRLCEQAFEEHDPERVVHVGDAQPFSLYSRSHPAATFREAEQYRFKGNEDRMDDIAERNAERKSSSALDHLRGVMRDATRSSEAIRAAVARHRPATEYPKGEFGERLRTVGAVAKSEIGTRVVSVEQGGYDTHVQQRSIHDRLMHDLDRGLEALYGDLTTSEIGRRTAIVVYSEFGRRVKENASRGTDHGAAGPMLVLSPAVNGGLHGRHPSLDDLDNGDLAYTTDFRSVYSSVIEAAFGISSDAVLGRRYESLPLFG